MQNSINLFMWGYQQHFRTHAQLAADSLFGSCDPALAPRVFLVGVLADARTDRHPICIEPEKNDLASGLSLTPAAFDEIAVAAQAVRAADPRSQMAYSHPIAASRAESAFQAHSLGEAIRQRLGAHSHFQDAIHFCSSAVMVDGFNVVVVLQLRRGAFESHYTLRQAIRDQVKLDVSFLDALIKVFLEDQEFRLSCKSPGEDWGKPYRPPEELLRAAGERLARAITFAAGTGLDSQHLFNVSNAVAAMNYEGEESLGGLILCSKGHPEIELDIEFRQPIPMQEHRAVRKLMEATTSTRKLVSDGRSLIGLGVLKGRYNGVSEDIFEVRFLKRYCWELRHQEHILMRVTAGQPQLHRSIGIEATVRDAIERAWPKLPARDISRLWKLVESASTLPHGCTLAIVNAAADEAHRLGGQAVEIVPTPGTTELILLASSIDGAILFDTEANCHAFGVILDGRATPTGDRSRGSRFNSATRYQQSMAEPCVVVVVSDDGMVDVIPKLRPRIQREAIEMRIQIVEAEAAKGTDASTRNYYPAIEWLHDHAFYLSSFQCERINRAKSLFEGAKVKSGEMTIVLQDLVPHPEMNDSFFLP